MSEKPPLPRLARRAGVAIAATAALTCSLVLPGQITVWLLAGARTYRDLLDASALDGWLSLALGAAALLCWLVAGIWFFRWLTAARANIERIPGVTPRYRRDWVVPAWFLPVANLVLPALVVAEVARASGVRRAGLLVWSWWAAFLAWLAILVVPAVGSGARARQGVAFFVIGDQVDPELRAQFIATHRPQYDVVLPALAVLAVAAVLAIVMIRSVTAAQAGGTELDAPSAPAFVPLRRLATLTTVAVVGVTAVLLSPAWLPASPSVTCDGTAAPCLGAYVDAAPGRETTAVAVAVVDEARFDPATPLGLAAWSLIVGGVAIFLWWLARARRNLDTLPGAVPRFRAGWSLGAWFIPAAGPVVGAMVVSDVARESHPPDPAAAAGTVGTPARYEAVRLVWVWALVAMAWPATYPPLWADLPAQPPTVGWPQTAVVIVLAALLAVAVVRRVTAAQHRRAADPAPPPAA